MSRVINLRWRGKTMLPILVGALLCVGSQAGVLYRDFEGRNLIETGPVYGPSTSNYHNNEKKGGGTKEQVIDALIALSEMSPSPAHSEVSYNGPIHWTKAGTPNNILCDMSFNANTDTCKNRITGRVTYAVLRFAQKGTYSFDNTWTDEYGRLDHYPINSNDTAPSTSFANLAYIKGLYVAGGNFTGAAGLGNGQLGTIVSPRAGSCVLIRYAWNNSVGANQGDLKWTAPGASAREVIPATALFDPSKFDYDKCVPQGSIEIAADSSPLAPASAVTYTIKVAADADAPAADGAVISNNVPQGIVAFNNWHCVATGGAVCPRVQGSGTLSETIATFPAGGQLVYTLAATVMNTPPQSINAEVTLTLPTSSGGMCNGDSLTCKASANLSAAPQITLTKTTDPAVILQPNGQVSYTVTMRNDGVAVAADGVRLNEPLPAGIVGVTWRCVSSNGALCPNVSGQNALDETIATMPAGGELVYTILGTIADKPPREINSVTTVVWQAGTNGVCMLAGAQSPCRAEWTLATAPQLTLTKTAVDQILEPDMTVVYTITVSNVGQDNGADAQGAQLADVMPTGIVSFDWTCQDDGKAQCPASSGSGDIDQTIAVFPANSVLTYTVNAKVDQLDPTLVTKLPAQIENVAMLTLAANSAGICNGQALTCEARKTLSTAPQVKLTKQTQSTALVPNTSDVYTITAENVGGVAADGTQVNHSLAAGIAAMRWTCQSTGGAICPNEEGDTPLDEVIAHFPVNSALTYTITATVADMPPATINQSAILTPLVGSSLVCINEADVVSSCTVAWDRSTAPQLTLTKTAVDQILEPDMTVVYTITVSNVGQDNGADAQGAQLADVMPTGIASFDWTCQDDGKAQCPASSGSGDIDQTIAVFPANSVLTYTVNAKVDQLDPTLATKLPAQIENVAMLTLAANSAGICNGQALTCEARKTLFTAPQVKLTRQTQSEVLIPGGEYVYTITAENVGGVAADGTQVNHSLAAGIAAMRWICQSTGGAICPKETGNVSLNEVITHFPVSGVLTYTITATVADMPPAVIDNIATITLPTGSAGAVVGVCVDEQGNPLADCKQELKLPPVPQVSVEIARDSASVVAMETVYTMTVTNIGNVDANDTQIINKVPDGIDVSSYEWTCSGSACLNRSGSGDINKTLLDFPVGGVAIYSIKANRLASAIEEIDNTVQVIPPLRGLTQQVRGVCAPGNTASPCTVATKWTRSNSTAVPVLGWLGLLGLCSVVACSYGFIQRRRR